MNEFKGIVDQIRNGEGSLGKLVSNDEAYNKAMAAVDKLNAMIDELQQGKGTAGKFLKDPALYNNANDTIANVKKLTDDINAGKGTLGKLTKDEALAKKLDNTITKLSCDHRSPGSGRRHRRQIVQGSRRSTTTPTRC